MRKGKIVKMWTPIYLLVALALVLSLAAIAPAQVSPIGADSAPSLEWDKTFGGTNYTPDKSFTTLTGTSQINLVPIEDSYVDSDYPDDNYGGSGSLYAESAIYTYSDNDYEISYLKFDLSVIPANATINSAHLELYARSTSTKTAQIGAHYCSDNSWSEIGITWNNRPSYKSEPTDSVAIAFDDQWYSWDITADVQSALSGGKLTEVLKSERTASGYEYVSFRSKDSWAEDERPKLVIQYDAIAPSAPTVTTNDASDITSNSATLNGNLTGLGSALSVSVSFEWGLTTAYGNESTAETKTSTGAFTAILSGLSPNTTYHFRAKAVGDDTSYGDDKSFTTPSVSLVPIEDSYVESDYPDDNYGGSGSLYAESAIYTYSDNDYEISYLKFDLSVIPANATINSAHLELYARSTSTKTAHIGAHYCSDNSWAEIEITWNNRPSYKSEPTDVVPIAFDDHWYSWDITSDVQSALSSGKLTEVLKSERTASGYEYVSFRSKDSWAEDERPKLAIQYAVVTPPAVTTNDATAITNNSAILNGNLSSLGSASSVNVSFQWGLTTAYGNETTAVVKTSPGALSAALSGLSPNTTYHFRAKAVGDGTSYGLDKSFTTQADEEFDPWYYDENENGIIEKIEAIRAIVDYFEGAITKAQAIQVIMLYFT